MSTRSKLFEVADRQQGYFTSKQAQECGIARSYFYRKLRSGEWVKALRGIYRLAQYPVSERPELALWILWSRDKKDRPQGIWSHETALDIHELSDIMPSKMHMTVPPRFRRQIEIPKNLKLHVATLAETDIEEHHGYRVTTPLRTLIDIVEEGAVPSEQIAKAIQDGLRSGILSLSQLMKNPKLAKYKNEYKI